MNLVPGRVPGLDVKPTRHRICSNLINQANMKREFCIRARREEEVLFELRSKDPRDLVLVIRTRVKGIKEIELAVEQVQGGRRTTRTTLCLVRGPHLFDDLMAISTRWSRDDAFSGKAPATESSEGTRLNAIHHSPG